MFYCYQILSDADHSRIVIQYKLCTAHRLRDLEKQRPLVFFYQKLGWHTHYVSHVFSTAIVAMGLIF